MLRAFSGGQFSFLRLVVVVRAVGIERPCRFDRDRASASCRAPRIYIDGLWNVWNSSLGDLAASPTCTPLRAWPPPRARSLRVSGYQHREENLLCRPRRCGWPWQIRPRLADQVQFDLLCSVCGTAFARSIRCWVWSPARLSGNHIDFVSGRNVSPERGPGGRSSDAGTVRRRQRAGNRQVMVRQLGLYAHTGPPSAIR